MSRVVGLAPWKPSDHARAIIAAVLEILDGEFRDYLPVTGRQIFYRLVGKYGYPKTEEHYKALLEKLNRARRCGMISWDSIRDDRISETVWTSYDTPGEFTDDILRRAKQYTRDRQDGQPRATEIWVEAAGMVPQVEAVAGRYGIPVYSSGGFNSSTMKWEAAVRVVERLVDLRPTIVLHVGDHDPSGVAIFENLSRDIPAMVRDTVENSPHAEFGIWEVEEHLGQPVSQWRRVAITPEQAERYGAEAAPPKRTDKRSRGWRGGTWQCEALSPAELAQELQAAIEEDIDVDVWDAVMSEEAVERDRLVAELEEMIE